MADRKKAPPHKWRIIGALNAVTGRVQTLDNRIVGRRQISDFLCQVHVAYPDPVRKISVIWDNWPVHLHAEVLETLKLLPHIELVQLPTYAPWLNPIEKLWRKFRQEVFYLHRLADDWTQFQTRMHQFFEQFSSGSLDLVRYVGLCGSGKLATALRSP